MFHLIRILAHLTSSTPLGYFLRTPSHSAHLLFQRLRYLGRPAQPVLEVHQAALYGFALL